MCLYVCVCLAKSGKTGRLYPASLGRDTQRNRQSCRCRREKRDERMVSPTLKAAHLLFPVIVLQVGPRSAPTIRGAAPSWREPDGEMQMQGRRRNIPVGIFVLEDYEGREEDFCYVFILTPHARSGAPDHWRTLSTYLRGSAGLLPEWHLGKFLSFTTYRLEGFLGGRLGRFLTVHLYFCKTDFGLTCWLRKRVTKYFGQMLKWCIKLIIYAANFKIEGEDNWYIAWQPKMSLFILVA